MDPDAGGRVLTQSVREHAVAGRCSGGSFSAFQRFLRNPVVIETQPVLDFEPGCKVGRALRRANRDAIDPDSLVLIKRFAERIGIVASLATHQNVSSAP